MLFFPVCSSRQRLKPCPHYAAAGFWQCRVGKANAANLDFGLSSTRELAFSRKMSDEEDVLVALGAFVIINHEKLRKRRFWVRPSLQSRRKYGTSELMKDLVLDDEDELNLEYRYGCGFKNFFRMKSSDFEDLLNKIARIIQKRDTSFRSAIPPHERLAVTLRFLATGDSYHSLSYTFKISKQIISTIIPTVCEAIVSVLQDYIKVRKNCILEKNLYLVDMRLKFRTKHTLHYK
ncbi:uncharacterized protein LOC124370247 [Homalodisca vitripennis]|uniref:uncharacterized protein LOC124370247 n=1 Tax=Homalodisca vitripennis TaxID=197043 RepID=UPI001EEB6CA6|nr:uncharacterized protein LOC124370247 [Homalodisca vitripennis]